MNREQAIARLRERLSYEQDVSERSAIQNAIDMLQPGFASPGGCGDRVLLSVTRKESPQC